MTADDTATCETVGGHRPPLQSPDPTFCAKPAVPYIIGLIGMILVGRHSDRTLERRIHAGLAYVAAAGGLAGVGLFLNRLTLAFAALVVAVAGPLSGSVVFWQIPPMLLAGSGAAGGIAFVNSIGSLGSWVSPTVIGWLEDVTGSTAAGLYVVAGLIAFGAVLILLFMPRRRPT